MEGNHHPAGDDTHFAAAFGGRNLSYNLINHYTIPIAVSGTFTCRAFTTRDWLLHWRSFSPLPPQTGRTICLVATILEAQQRHLSRDKTNRQLLFPPTIH
jgi:hypothetical protein